MVKQVAALVPPATINANRLVCLDFFFFFFLGLGFLPRRRKIAGNLGLRARRESRQSVIMIADRQMGRSLIDSVQFRRIRSPHRCFRRKRRT